MKLGSAIQSLRLKKGLSIEDLASEMELSEDELQAVEAGEKNFRVSMNQAQRFEMKNIIEKAADALGVGKEIILVLSLEQDDLAGDKRVAFMVMEKSIIEKSIQEFILSKIVFKK